MNPSKYRLISSGITLCAGEFLPSKSLEHLMLVSSTLAALTWEARGFVAEADVLVMGALAKR
jgi:hypothetical protein